MSGTTDTRVISHERVMLALAAISHLIEQQRLARR